MDDFEEKDRKEIRKKHLKNKNRNRSTSIDEETKFAHKASKARKYRLEALEEEELYDEWGDYLKK
jgi:hypothetical protein